MNLYIFNEMSQAAVFGIGTYIRELTAALQNSQMNVCLVNIWSDKPQVQKEEISGIQHWHFPEPMREQQLICKQKLLELYFRNVVYLLQLHIEDKRDLIFHLNYMECKPLADELKSVFDCKVMLVVHYFDSIMTLLGNISRLRRIISQTNEPTKKEEISAKKSFQEEKEILHTVDKIICLSYHTYKMLHLDYQVTKEKMIVIHNGLSDATI